MNVKIGVCQLHITDNKEINIERAKNAIMDAVANDCKIVVLPEMFNCPYENSYFPKFAETQSENTVNVLSKIAKENKIYLFGGSIPEIDQGKIYNTAFIFDPEGNIIGKHRKVHLFDIDIKDGVRFKESDTLTPGDEVTVVDTIYGKIGCAICYDMRFPELMRLMALKGAKMIVVPAAFNMTTGPAHWDLTLRARALDNQVYYIAASPARDTSASYHAYGHSSVVSPWGEIVAQLDEKPNNLYCEMDLDYVGEIRDQLPLLKHRRTDLYCLKEK